jgi:3-isopropylmalate dehydrogenase
VKNEYTIGVLIGDGIGLDVVPVAVDVMQAAIARADGVNFSFKTLPVGWSSYLENGHTLPETTLSALADMDGFILGPIGHAAYPRDDPNCINPHPVLRRMFDLYANLRPTKSLTGVSSSREGIDLLIVRENNEGFQPDRNMVAGSGEFKPTDDTALSLRVITRRGSTRVARAGFEAARARGGKKRVTAIHKRTVFKLTDGLFMDSVEAVAREYPDITLDDFQVDTFAMKLIMQPERYDVVLCTNLFGDILSDEAAALVGGLGLAPGLNIGDRYAMAQATHGSAPDIADKHIANPYAMVMSGVMLLDWLGRRNGHQALVDAAALASSAVATVVDERKAVTTDLGGESTTDQMGAAIVEAVEAASSAVSNG